MIARDHVVVAQVRYRNHGAVNGHRFNVVKTISIAQRKCATSKFTVRGRCRTRRQTRFGAYIVTAVEITGINGNARSSIGNDFRIGGQRNRVGKTNIWIKASCGINFAAST